MKILGVNNANYQQNSTKNRKKNVNFTGMADGLVKFWQTIDNGGRALQFTVEDMCGTNIPRTYKGAMAGYKYTGEVNVPALLQEATREFLTGPTMCLVPLGVLGVATRLSGESVNTHFENITNLSHIMTKLKEGSLEESFYKESFYKEITKDMLTQTIGKEAEEENIDSIVKAIKQYEKSVHEMQKAKGKDAKNKAKECTGSAFGKLQDLYETIIKTKKESYLDTDFLNVRYSINNNKKGATKFKNYMDYSIAYAQDFSKQNSKNGLVSINQDTIKNFKNTALGKRAFTAINMIVLTGTLMSIIPKIYTIISGNINPNAKTIYNEANKKGGK